MSYLADELVSFTIENLMNNDIRNTASVTNNTTFFNGSCRKGDIWFVTSGDSKTTGTEIWPDRPAVIVSNEGFNAKAGFVNVVYLTTSTKSNRPYHIPVMSDGRSAIALCEQTPPIDKSRLSFYMGHVTPEEMLEIDKAILFAYNISNTLRPNSLFQKWVNSIDRYNIDISENPNDDMHIDNNADIEFSDTSVLIDNLTKQRDKYKMLYENSQQTIMKLMNMS